MPSKASEMLLVKIKLFGKRHIVSADIARDTHCLTK